MNKNKNEGSSKEREKELLSANEMIEAKIGSLIEKAINFRLEGEGSQLWHCCSMLSTLLEGYMPQQTADEMLAAEAQLYDKLGKIEKDVKDPAKRERRQNATSFNYGARALNALLRVYARSPLVEKRITASLSVDSLEEISDYDRVIQDVQSRRSLDVTEGDDVTENTEGEP